MANAVSARLRPLILAGAAALIGLAGWYAGSGVEAPPAVRPVKVDTGFANLPLAFEPNQGQSGPAVQFQSRMPGYSLYLSDGDAVIGMRGTGQPLRMRWRHANRDPAAAGLDPLPGKHHYLKGSDPAHWHRNIPTYGKVRYRNLYPGIDLVYYGRGRRLEYDLVVAPGADPKPIELALSGMDGLQLGADGAVQLQFGRRSLSLSRPIIYQETGHGHRPVDGGYVRLARDRLGVRLGAYDTSRPLIIDPVLSFSTYLGGTGAELARGVAAVPGGDVYVVGETTSGDIPFSNGNKAGSDTDVLLAQFDPSGTLQAVVYLGGSGTDRGFAVAADANYVYLVGDTAGGFPVTNDAAQLSNRGVDAFFAKLDARNNLNPAYATYLGGSEAEEALGVAVDAAGNAYVAGATLSSDFPHTAGTFNGGSTATCTDQANATIPCSDGFVAKYDGSGNVSFATYLGGRLEDTANAIAVSTGGEVFVTGLAYSEVDASFSNIFFGPPNAYLAVLDGSSGAVTHGIYIGGTGFDQGQGVAVDGSGYVYLAGITASSDLPTVGALQASYLGGGLDGFVAKFRYDGTLSPPFQTQYLTYLGGSPQNKNLVNDGRDQIYGIAADAGGNAYVVGETMSADFPEKLALQRLWFGSGRNGWGDAFVTKITPSGGLAWSTFLGGGGDDWATGVAQDGNRGVYVSGSTFSGDFPTSANPFQAANQGDGDGFLFKLADDDAATADLKVDVAGTPDLVGTGETITYTVVVSNQSTLNNANGVLVRASLPAGLTYQSSTPANRCTVSGQQLDCLVGTIAAGGSATTTIEAANNTAGDITFTAAVVRAFQSDPTQSNDSASTTTKAALGSSGGGSWAPFEAATLIGYAALRRRRGRRSRPA